MPGGKSNKVFKSGNYPAWVMRDLTRQGNPAPGGLDNLGQQGVPLLNRYWLPRDNPRRLANSSRIPRPHHSQNNSAETHKPAALRSPPACGRRPPGQKRKWRNNRVIYKQQQAERGRPERVFKLVPLILAPVLRHGWGFSPSGYHQLLINKRPKKGESRRKTSWV